MATFDVRSEIFEGPLDLLLYLIKREDMDIRDINISDITQEYLHTIDLMKQLDLEMAGEFLVMASTLLQIKAKMLLPKENLEGDGDEGPDPRADLVAKLLEYQKYKEAASFLSDREYRARNIFYRNITPTFADEDLTLEATLFDLLDAFKDVLKKAGEEIKDVLFEEIPLESKIREIMDILESDSFVQFSHLFSKARNRRELIVTFLALLELIRLKQAVAKQSEGFGEIRIYRVTQKDPAMANPTEETPKPEYN